MAIESFAAAHWDGRVLALPGPYFGPGQENHLRIAIANVAADRIEGLRERLTGFSV